MFYAEMDVCMDITFGSVYFGYPEMQDHLSLRETKVCVSTANIIEVSFLSCVLDLEKPAGHSDQVSYLLSPSMVT